MEQRTVDALTKDIRIFSATVQTKGGDKPAYVIEWHTIQGDGTELPVQAFLMTPEQLKFLSERLQEAVRQQESA